MRIDKDNNATRLTKLDVPDSRKESVVAGDKLPHRERERERDRPKHAAHVGENLSKIIRLSTYRTPITPPVEQQPYLFYHTGLH